MAPHGKHSLRKCSVVKSVRQIAFDKASHQCGDFIRSRLQCEVAGVENMDLRVRCIRFGSRKPEVAANFVI